MGGTNDPRCLACGAPVVHAFRPFCSRRCADADLWRWLTEGYALPGDAEPSEDSVRDETGEER